MRSPCLRLLVINGVRYHLAVCTATNWSYLANWYNNTPGDCAGKISRAEREAIDEIQRARLKKEPWLHAEIAGADLAAKDIESGSQ